MATDIIVKKIQGFKVFAKEQDLFSKLKSTGLYLLVPLINFSVSIFTSPIFARYLTAQEFGYLGYFTSLATFISCFYGLLFQTYYMSVYFRENEQERREVLSTLTLFNVLWNLVFFPLSYVGLYFYFKLTHSEIPFYPFALFCLGGGVLGTYKGFIQVNYRLSNKPIAFVLLVSGYRVLSTLASLYFVAYAKMGLQGRLLGAFIVEVLFLIFSMYLILKGTSLKIHWSVLKKAYKIILPLFPASFLLLPLGNFDNIVLERLNQSAEMGLYNIGKGIASYVYIALFPFYQTFEPNIYKNVVQGNFRSLKVTGGALIALIIVSVIGFWIVSPYIIDYLTAGKYLAAVHYANILALTSGLMIIFSFFDAIINALQETKKHLYINSIIAVICVATYSVFGLYFKQVGVAVATIITYCLLILLQATFVVRKIKILSSAHI
ncbi:lipopolysaccharide biosynthesis protein [Pedobacter endophyticus]|uniref:Oligosaccharide flippase family protein n=1 Tax=Pedobacter endophyticus TaxID=2789740 RepID=A0A7S9PYX8_9SPHI|nr:oligosaccharide flippase family protein [Pedobacter endophyticus]QPH39933.1 oligosaccharide flippase family protein [Pedobacter endophyticus]